jgi:hypothetical protein
MMLGELVGSENNGVASIQSNFLALRMAVRGRVWEGLGNRKLP